MDIKSSRRTAIGMALLALTEIRQARAADPPEDPGNRECRVQGHPCVVGGQECCPVEGGEVECRAFEGEGLVTRCAVVGQPDPPPVDPPDIIPIPDTVPVSSLPGFQNNRKKAEHKRCQHNSECKSHKCQKDRCCDPRGNHCRSNNGCCTGDCGWILEHGHKQCF